MVNKVVYVPKMLPPTAAWKAETKAVYERAKADKEAKAIKAHKVYQNRCKARAARGEAASEVTPEMHRMLEYKRRRAEQAKADRAKILGYYGGVLPSSLSEISAHLVQSTRVGDRLLCGEDKLAVGIASCKMAALFKPYLTANEKMVRVIRVDIDRNFEDIHALRKFLDDRRVPHPNFVVYARGGDITRRADLLDDSDYGQNVIVRPHFIWCLRDAVCYSEKGHAGPKKKLEAVTRALTAACEGDDGGLSNGLKFKNPLSPAWENVILRDFPYNLDEIAECVDTKRKPAKLDVNATWVADHMDPAVASQSNRLWAMVSGRCNGSVLTARATMTREDFVESVADDAAERAGTMSTESYFRELGAKCARWAWDNVKARKTTTPGEVKAAQAKAGRRTGKMRGHENAKVVISAIARLEAAGEKVTQAKIAAECGLSLKTVKRRISASGSQKKGHTLTPVKKGVPSSRLLPLISTPLEPAVSVEPEQVTEPIAPPAPAQPARRPAFTYLPRPSVDQKPRKKIQWHPSPNPHARPGDDPGASA